jgi:hypothetical protein
VGLPRSAAPSAPDLLAGLPLALCGLSTAPCEFTACDQDADCTAALEGAPLLRLRCQSQAADATI